MAQAQQNYLIEVLEGEMVRVKAVKDYHEDFKKDVIKMRTTLGAPTSEDADERIVKY